MNKFLESPLYQALCGIFDLIVMNVLFLLCCVPVITIGAALSALNFSAHSLASGSSFHVRKFMASFKSGFRQSTMAFLAGVVGTALLLLDFWIISSKMQSFAKYPVLGIVLSGVLLCLFILSYIFPIITISDRSFKDIVRLSIYCSVKNLCRTIVICVLNLLPMLLFLFWPYAFIVTLIFWLLIGFALFAYVNSLLLRPTYQMLDR